MSAAVISPKATVEVGDFFSCSWGYDQTNVDFYKVVGLTPSGKSVRVQKWSKAIDHSDYHDYVVPGEGPATYFDHSAATPEMDFWDRQEVIVERPVEVETKRLRSGPGTPHFRVNSYSLAGLWDGRPEYQTGANYQR